MRACDKPWRVIFKVEIYGNIHIKAKDRQEAIELAYKLKPEKFIKERKEVKCYVMGAFQKGED